MNEKIIEKLNIVVPDVQSVTGSITRDDVTPSEVFSGGVVHYIDKKLLNPFATGRSAMHRICRARGVRFLSGWAVPDAALDAVKERLAEEKRKIDAAIQDFLAAAPDAMREWREAHPEIEPYVGRFPSMDWIRSRMRVSISVFKISPEAGESNGVYGEVNALAYRTLEEIAQDVRLSWDPSRAEATQKVRGIFQRIITKLHTLKFLGGGLGDVADAIAQTAAALPTDGKITGRDFLILSGVMRAMSSPEDMLAMAEQMKRATPQELWSRDYLGEEIRALEQSAQAAAQPTNPTPHAAPAAEPLSAAAIDSWSW